MNTVPVLLNIQTGTRINLAATKLFKHLRESTMLTQQLTKWSWQGSLSAKCICEFYKKPRMMDYLELFLCFSVNWLGTIVKRSISMFSAQATQEFSIGTNTNTILANKTSNINRWTPTRSTRHLHEHHYICCKMSGSSCQMSVANLRQIETLCSVPRELCWPWYQGSWGQHGAHLGPTGPRWAPCLLHELWPVLQPSWPRPFYRIFSPPS